MADVIAPRRERHIADIPERAVFTVNGTPYTVWLMSLTRDTARLRGHDFAKGDTGTINIRGVGEVPAFVVNSAAEGVRIDVMPDDEQLRQMTVRFYTEGGAPGVTTVRASALFRDIARRLSFNSNRH